MSFFQALLFLGIVYFAIPVFKNLEQQIVKDLLKSK